MLSTIFPVPSPRILRRGVVNLWAENVNLSRKWNLLQCAPSTNQTHIHPLGRDCFIH